MYKRGTGMTSFFVTVIGASAGTPLCHGVTGGQSFY